MFKAILDIACDFTLSAIAVALAGLDKLSKGIEKLQRWATK